ncbi:hypothetical protein [Streptacidiphilus anmyonensis]|uniref:hypothetical protein n=1 Tax=Streptacidiphilus anmyonensis TaxID=405782 RepID=UPI0005A99438|nr:hypothetical protein [Streptacidiphilus anmyonensis]
MAKHPVPKHLTITIDFDLQTEGSTVQYQRAHTAYVVAVEAAIEEARRVLPPDSIKEITSEIDWSYRWQRRTHPRYTRAEAVPGGLAEDVVDEGSWDDPGVVWDHVRGEWLPTRMTPNGDVEVGPFDDDDEVA